jgi:ABC-type xylose transport system permease subunit
MKYLLRALLVLSAFVIVLAGRGVFRAFIVWDMVRAPIGPLPTRYSPNLATSHSLELWSGYLVMSLIVFVILYSLYRHQYGIRNT